MIQKASIAFTSLDEDTNARVTKFGGQPGWLTEPQWPLSAELGRPMRFICQIALTDELFPGHGGKLAYVFMTDDDEDYVDDTQEPDGGENAVILQPGGALFVDVAPLTKGPTLRAFVNVPGEHRLQPKPVVFGVTQTLGDDPDFIDRRSPRTDNYLDVIAGNKLGGTPGFLQADEFPDTEQPWHLLLQLDSVGAPFSINFGDAGIGYAFINADATVGKFLWQCA